MIFAVQIRTSMLLRAWKALGVVRQGKRPLRDGNSRDCRGRWNSIEAGSALSRGQERSRRESVSTRTSSRYDAIILGAGAAGMMCALTAGQRGRKVLLIDHADEPGKKILISGGGRCNFTNLHTPPERYLSANRHFAKSALRRYRPEDFIALVERHHISWHEKTLGQLFCDGSARQIVAMLLEECAKGQVELRLGHAVQEVEHADGIYRVSCGDEAACAPALVIATGGPSIPKMGATGFAYDLARKFGLAVLAPRPALVPLTLGKDETLFQSLSGVSADVATRCGNVAFREAALFTHKGLSGPAILQISSYWTPGERSGSTFCRRSDRPGLSRQSAAIPVPRCAPCWRMHCLRASPKLWPSAPASAENSQTFPTGHSNRLSGGFPTGAFAPPARKGSPKPR